MITINGKTQDSYGFLPSVNIREVGTNNSRQSDDNGNFSITVNSPASIIQFSFVGYATVTLTASELLANKIVDMVLDSELLDEVIVLNPHDNDTKKSNLGWWIFGGIVVLGTGFALYKNGQTKKPKLAKPNPTKKRKVKKAKKTVHVSL